MRAGEIGEDSVSTEQRHLPPVEEAAGARLGIIALDTPYMSRAAADPSGEDARDPFGTAPPEGFLSNAASWPMPVLFDIATGATSEATLEADSSVEGAVQDAVGRLEQRGCALIISNCGFFFHAQRAAGRDASTPVMLSSLNLLDTVLGMTRAPVGVLTYSGEQCRRLLAEHEALDRLRIVGYDHLPTWAQLNDPDWPAHGQVSVRALGEEFLTTTEQELRGGSLRDAAVLVLECTVMPQFRPSLRAITKRPIVDVRSFALSLLQ